MTGPADRLAALGLTLPPVTAPVAAYVPALRTGAYVYVSGQVPVAAFSFNASPDPTPRNTRPGYSKLSDAKVSATTAGWYRSVGQVTVVPIQAGRARSPTAPKVTHASPV